MNLLIGLIGVLATVSLLGSCSAGKLKTPDTLNQAHAIARDRFKNNYEMIPNSNRMYVLCTSKAKERAGVPIQPVRFFVYQLTKDSVVFESELENGSVEWRNATQLIIKRIPGNITGDEGPDAFTEVYDLETRMTTKR